MHLKRDLKLKGLLIRILPEYPCSTLLFAVFEKITQTTRKSTHKEFVLEDEGACGC